MAALQTGARVRRLAPSTSGRDVRPGDVGRIDDYRGPGKYFPVQWERTGLWSSLHPGTLGEEYELVGNEEA